MDYTKTAELISSNNLEIAMQHAQMMYWEYDVQNASARSNALAAEWFGLPSEIKNFPDDFLKSGFVAPEFVEAYRSACRRM